MTSTSTILPEHPPRHTTDLGNRRRIGVEIEFAGLSAKEAANHVAHHYDGTVTVEDPHRYRIATLHGEFIAELDLQYAHKDEKEPTPVLDVLETVGLNVPTTVGDMMNGIAPVEIVSPPLYVDGLLKFDELVTSLACSGAEGTEEHPIYAFGLHLNPEVPEKSSAYLLSVLRAYMLLASWLREEAKQDFTRKVLPFAQSFPVEYAEYILNPAYSPDISTLIDDYLRFNDTRNRELDCLPLFSDIDQHRVMATVNDDRVNARPTFHYRLPDARLRDVPSLVCREWNRWVAVERLADNVEKLEAMSIAFLEQESRLLGGDWDTEVKKWL